MARKLRVQYEGAIYHVMNRGDRREPIFLDDQDPECFLETLGESCLAGGVGRRDKTRSGRGGDAGIGRSASGAGRDGGNKEDWAFVGETGRTAQGR